jgi:hypothetical protein
LAGVAWCCGTAGAAEGTAKPIRVLVVTGGHDFEHTEFLDLFRSIPGIEWKEAVQPAANDLYTKEAAAAYDVLVFYDMVQKIGDEQKANLMCLLKEDGKGLVALHHCVASYQDWPEYRQIIGGAYYLNDVVENGAVTHAKSTYDHDQHFRVNIVDGTHPVTLGIKDFDIVDETYGGFDALPDVSPLLRVDYPKSAPVVGWAHPYGKARVVYIQLGHGPTAYTNANYRQLIANAIQWVDANGKDTK